jgi:hypothetical protein
MTTTRDLVQDRRDQYAFHDDIVYLRETKRGPGDAVIRDVVLLQLVVAEGEPGGRAETEG